MIILTKKIVPIMPSSEEKRRIMCAECGNNDAVIDCITCGDHLCDSCKSDIHKFKMTSNHIFATLGTLVK